MKCNACGTEYETHGCGVSVKKGLMTQVSHEMRCPLRMPPAFEQRPVPGVDVSYLRFEAPPDNCPVCYHVALSREPLNGPPLYGAP